MRYRRMCTIDQLRDGTAEPSLVILDLMETGRDVRRGRDMARTATNPITRRFAEEQAEQRAERYEMQLSQALDLIEEVRAHRPPRWVSQALESRFVDGQTWRQVADEAGVTPTKARAECYRALEWLDKRHAKALGIRF